MTTHRIAEVEGSKALTRSRLWQSGHRQLAGRRPRQERRGAYLPLRPRLALGGDGQAGSSIRGRWRLPPGDTPGLGTAVGGGARAASIKVSGRLTRSVRGIAAGGRHAVVLAGSCNVAPMGVWVGAGAADAGAVWIDAHADFQTRAALEVELRRALHRT